MLCAVPIFSQGACYTMVRHIIFWTFSDNVNDSNRKEVVGKIPGLIKAEIGENFADSDCDFVFYAEFERMENIPAFQVHPLHVAHKERSAPYVKTRFVADYVSE